jgi:2-polyprenyl-3-methyl-5-hydroxy-6-metoxy-1,4-benzoquinol methylase
MRRKMLSLDTDYKDAEVELAGALRACVTQHAPRVLEAGGGALSHLAVPARSHITVIDISQEQLDRNHYAHEKVLGDLHTHEFPRESFDIIVCWNVLEHLENPKRVLEAFVRWLSPGGVIVIAAPNPLSLTGLITKFTPHSFHVWVLKNVLGAPAAGQPGKGPFPTYMDKSMYPSALAAMFQSYGLKLVHLRRYASARLHHLRAERPLVGNAYLGALRGIKVATLGRWQPEHSDFHLIAQKPE